MYMCDAMKSSTDAFHWYSTPSDPAVAIKNAVEIGKKWNIPTLMTEFMSCKVQLLAEAAKIGWSYWHCK